MASIRFGSGIAGRLAMLDLTSYSTRTSVDRLPVAISRKNDNAMTSDGAAVPRRQAKSSRKGGLGRGLDALIPARAPEPSTTDTASDSPNGAFEVAIDAIKPNPYQPRSHMDRRHLEELTASIRTHGVVQPLIVTPTDIEGQFHLIAGERRWRAAKRVGLTTVPAIVKSATPQAMLELALVENIVRANLNPLEEATAFQRLIEEFGVSQAELAGRVGRSRVAVSNTLRLLNAPASVQDALLRGQVTEGHARALLGLPSASDQNVGLKLVLEQQLNVRQTELLVRRWDRDKTISGRSRERSPDERRIEKEFGQALGTQVGYRRRSDGNGGTLTIQVYSDEEMQALYSRLVGDDSW